MATTTTTNLAMTLAVPGTNEPFSTAVVNANLEAVDAEVGVQRADNTAQASRLTTVEKITLPTVAAADFIGGTVPRGTTAQRDGYWGIPGDATARVALANRIARWWNTDKGYEQQYFAQWDDASVGSAPAKTTHGWGPALADARVLLHLFTVGGTGAQKRGATTYLSADLLAVTIDGVFTADFDTYELELYTPGVNVSTDCLAQLRAAGVDLASGYTTTHTETSGAGSVTGFAAASQAAARIGRMDTNAGGTAITTRITNPAHTLAKHFRGESYDSGGNLRVLGSYHTNATAHDGIKLTATGTVFKAGTRIRVYGIAGA